MLANAARILSTSDPDYALSLLVAAHQLNPKDVGILDELIQGKIERVLKSGSSHEIEHYVEKLIEVQDNPAELSATLLAVALATMVDCNWKAFDRYVEIGIELSAQLAYGVLERSRYWELIGLRALASGDELQLAESVRESAASQRNLLLRELVRTGRTDYAAEHLRARMEQIDDPVILEKLQEWLKLLHDNKIDILLDSLIIYAIQSSYHCETW